MPKFRSLADMMLKEPGEELHDFFVKYEMKSFVKENHGYQREVKGRGKMARL